MTNKSLYYIKYVYANGEIYDGDNEPMTLVEWCQLLGFRWSDGIKFGKETIVPKFNEVKPLIEIFKDCEHKFLQIEEDYIVNTKEDFYTIRKGIYQFAYLKEKEGPSILITPNMKIWELEYKPQSTMIIDALREEETKRENTKAKFFIKKATDK